MDVIFCISPSCEGNELIKADCYGPFPAWPDDLQSYNKYILTVK